LFAELVGVGLAAVFAGFLVRFHDVSGHLQGGEFGWRGRGLFGLRLRFGLGLFCLQLVQLALGFVGLATEGDGAAAQA
jgi:hypothetical protein